MKSGMITMLEIAATKSHLARVLAVTFYLIIKSSLDFFSTTSNQRDATIYGASD